MTIVNKEYKSKYSVKQLYDLVVDIEKYPEFLPWCSSSSIVEKTDDKIIADLFITFKALSEHYRSTVLLTKPTDGSARVDVSSESDLFQNMENIWEFKETDSGTIVKFYIDFKFKSFLLEKLIGIFFTSVCDKMIDAFESRAVQIYG